jgi:hypothetical protein
MTYDVIPRRSPEESCMTPANTSDHCFRMAERATEFAPPFLTLEVPGFALTGVAPATNAMMAVAGPIASRCKVDS